VRVALRILGAIEKPLTPAAVYRVLARLGDVPVSNAGSVTCEVTSQDLDTALERLHMQGFSLSIDDFGSGYSWMEQLRHVPFAEMKIDRAFVRGAGETAKTRTILESSVNLGRSLQMSVVAEGAETQDDWNAVCAAGVDLVQGYFIAKPLPAVAIPGWLANWADGNAIAPDGHRAVATKTSTRAGSYGSLNQA
jgi:EAL domain-containing protein (putative c-di-GMP-specific phosphodiesterase class I)